jgi:hypothetical protein
MLPMQQLQQRFDLSSWQDWPNAVGLNQLRSAYFGATPAMPEFVCQSSLPKSVHYYEQIIYQQGLIPTRPNTWHDLFNGLVWLQFPLTKTLINQQHVQDIEAYGLSPRTLRRNNLTHFDECGVIVTYECSEQVVSLAQQLISALRGHEWHTVFVENRDLWGKQLNVFMFGHANLEMLLAPYLGLTGKWLAVPVDSDFASLPYRQQLAVIDAKLSAEVAQQDVFAQKKPLYPLPLLGVPQVWEANKAPSFYANKDYFRPKPRAKIPLANQ